ncbi:MAG: hypothetical protein WCE68_16145 [Anaerolineales bacterium]
MIEKLHPVHPGEVLLEGFIKPLKLSQNRLAIEIGVDARPNSFGSLSHEASQYRLS